MTRIMPPSYPLRQHRASMGSLPESRFPGQCDSLPRSSDKSAAFCFALPLLIDRIAVSHDARPGLHMHDAIFQHGSAQNDAAIHVPIRRKIADAARRRPSRLRLQFRDDLACADLGRARDGPGGKACEQRIQGVLGRIKPPDHIRYKMHDMAIEFDDIAVRHRSEEHTSELQSLMRISYAVFCLKKKT